jgi:hypothetical protein
MSLRAAINEKCRDCIVHKSNPGTWRQQITMCPQTDCPLWLYRPLSYDSEAILGNPRDKQSVDLLRGVSAEDLLKLAKQPNDKQRGES